MTTFDVGGIIPLVANGTDGRSVVAVMLGDDGHLRCVMSDNTTVDAGSVQGAVDLKNLSPAINISTTPPVAPAVNEIWIDIS